MSVWPDAPKLDDHTTLTLTRKTGVEQIDFDRRDMVVEELEEFASCVKGEAEPETGAVEGTAALSVVLGALESHATGKAVEL
jgi:predicted dehydrogenase